MPDEEVVGVVLGGLWEGMEDAVDSATVCSAGNDELIHIVADMLHVHSIGWVPVEVAPNILALGDERGDDTHFAGSDDGNHLGELRQVIADFWSERSAGEIDVFKGAEGSAGGRDMGHIFEEGGRQHSCHRLGGGDSGGDEFGGERLFGEDDEGNVVEEGFEEGK